MLDTKKVNDLKNLIKDSFRVRPNHDTIYIDVGNHLERLKAKQHQIIFGRRGSGKSSLLVHFKNNESKKLKIHTIYVDTDELKRLGYPDLLIRLLLAVLEKMPSANHWWRRWIFYRNDVQIYIDELRKLLKKADESQVVEQENLEKGANAGMQYGPVSFSGSGTISQGKQSEFLEQKLDSLERNLTDYKKALTKSLNSSKFKNSYILIDDFYLLPRNRQPDVIDYLHRLFRGTDFYLKIGTVRHRTSLIRNIKQTIGVKLRQDVEEINLDRTLEDLDATSDYLSKMLDSMASSLGIEDASTNLFNQQGFESLVLASGGVPRDFLNIFVEAINSSLSTGKSRWLTPTHIWKGASRLSYRTKLSNLRSDTSSEATKLEQIFRDLFHFCIQEKKKTAFLISQEESQKYPEIHELILQLMDFKLIHVIEPDTSAAAGRKGRFEAYTLDFSLFMEPRKRNIDIVEFWKYDEKARRVGVREAPAYNLHQAKEMIKNEDNTNTEDFVDKIESEVE